MRRQGRLPCTRPRPRHAESVCCRWACHRDGNRRAHRRHELDAGRGVPAARRPRGAAARQHRAAQLPAADRGLHPPRAGRRRRRRAARRPGVPGAALRRHAVLPRVPRLDLAARRDAPARRARHPRRHGAQRLPPHPDRQRPRRQQRRAAVRAGVGRRSPRLPGASSTTGGTRRAPGPRCRRSIRSRRTARGWRTSRGRGSPASSMPDDAAADGRPGARARARSGRAARSTSATATTAACISAPTRRCWRSGRSPSRRRARCSTGSWGDAS